MERENEFTILVSESSYPMDNVPTHQTTIQSYALDGNELIPRDNTDYNGLREAKVRVYGSSVGRTEASGTGCGRLPSEVTSSPAAKELSVLVSASRESQHRNF